MLNPLDEARRWLGGSLAAGRSVPPSLCVIGAGAGWIVDAIEEHSAEAKILVFEPEPAFTRLMLARRDLRHLIEDGRLMVIAGPSFEGAATAWRLYGRCVSEPKLLIHPIIGVARKEATVTAARFARKAIADARANESARRRLAAPYLLNTLRNLPVLTREANASGLFDLCARRPVVIAGAGPSLNRNLEELRPFRDRVVFISSDTALRTSVAAGLPPDFVVGVDPAAPNARHFSSLPSCEKTALVAEPSLQSEIFDGFAGRTFLFRVASHQPWPWLRSQGVDVTMLRAWGSVMITAFDLAAKLGGDPLIFIGTDLAYTDGQPYCRGTIYENDWAEWMAQGKSLDEIWNGAIAMHPEVAEVHNGQQVATAPHLVQFRDALVNAARSLPRRVINATGRGIFHGDQIEQLPLSAALRDATPFSIPTLPRPTQSPTSVARLRELLTMEGTLSNDLEGGLSEWKAIFAEHEPSDPSLDQQLTNTLADMAAWAQGERS